MTLENQLDLQDPLNHEMRRTIESEIASLQVDLSDMHIQNSALLSFNGAQHQEPNVSSLFDSFIEHKRIQLLSKDTRANLDPLTEIQTLLTL